MVVWQGCRHSGRHSFSYSMRACGRDRNMKLVSRFDKGRLTCLLHSNIVSAHCCANGAACIRWCWHIACLWLEGIVRGLESDGQPMHGRTEVSDTYCTTASSGPCPHRNQARRTTHRDTCISKVTLQLTPGPHTIPQSISIPYFPKAPLSPTSDEICSEHTRSPKQRPG